MLNVCPDYCSLIDSNSETADQRVTLANEGMFGSWATSSSRLMAFAALTATLTLASWSIRTESLTIFLMFRGVMFESEIWVRLTTAFASLASFSCCFFSFALMERTYWFRSWCSNMVGLSVFRAGRVKYEGERRWAQMSAASKDKMKLAAELVSRGATMLAEPCPRDGGIQVRYRGKVYCTAHDDLSAITMASAVSLDTVVAQLREVLLTKLNEATAALGAEKDPAKQDQLVSLAAKYYELLQKLPHK